MRNGEKMKDRLDIKQSKADQPQQNAKKTLTWREEIERNQEQRLNRLLLIALVLGAVGIVVYARLLPEGLSAPSSWRTLAPFLLGLAITFVLIIWRALSYVYRSAVLVFTVYLMACFIFARSGLSGSGRLWLLLIPVLSFILIGPRSGVFTAILSVLTYTFFVIAIDQRWIVPWVSDNLTLLWTPLSNFLIIITVISTMLWSFHRVWIETIQKSEQTKQDVQEQSSRLADINLALQRQAAQLQATAEINRAVSAILDPNRLLDEIVNRVQNAFDVIDVYYVALYLLDENGQFAELEAATGETGRLHLEAGEKVKIDDESAVGWSIRHQKARAVLGVVDGAGQPSASTMPHTRSELVLPLRARRGVIGALRMRSAKAHAFEESDISILQMMADQIALYIDNAHLFSQTEAALEEVQAVQRRYLTQAWQDFLAMEAINQVEYVQPGAEVSPDRRIHQAQRQAVAEGKTIILGKSAEPLSDGEEEKEKGDTALIVPIKLREEIIGALTMHGADRQHAWSPDDIAMVEAIAEQTALTIDNLRLFQEIQRRAARERLVSEATAHMRETLDVDTVLKTAVQQIREGMGLHDVTIQLGALNE